ncbi:hypothetical protein V6N11_039477 [Hibiscus sabdariffa]|uniref:RNase H type-1 domain-containing protein n=1 Tax=Hibiscus sabdariffa TaxID=183260 RepID=A0ABR2SNB1_9ROSI
MIDCNGGGIGTGWRNYYRGSLLSVLLRYNLHVVMVGRTNRFGNGNRMVNFQDSREDIDHILHQCIAAKEIWRRLISIAASDSFSSLPFRDWMWTNLFDSTFNSGDEEWPARFIITFWLLWKYRCSFVLDPAMGAWEDIIARGNRLVAETSRAFCVTVEPCGNRSSDVCWERLPLGWIKVNVDAAVSMVDGSTGIGRCPVLLAELWAIHDGLAQAWMRGYRHVEIEPNSLEVVRLVSSASIEMQEYGLVLSIKRWISHDWQVRVQHVSHGHNNVAYKLAAKGRRLEFTNSSFVMILGDVEDLVAKERERSTPARVRSGNFVDFPYDLGGS